MRSNYKAIGDIVEKIDERNFDGKINSLVGLSINKCFISSVANIIGTDLTKYKVIRKDNFAVNLMQVSRDSKIPVARFTDDSAIMSPACSIFKVKNKKEVLPEYIDMWFKRAEFDREASFIAVGGVRGSMPWEEFARMKIKIPQIDQQRKIVAEYTAVTDRIALKQKINDNLEATTMAIFKSWFIDYEPFECNEDGFPVDWIKITLDKKLTTSTQSVNPQKMQNEYVWHYSIPAYDCEKLPTLDTSISILSNKYLVPENAILVSKLNPETKRIWRKLPCFKDAICSTEFIVFSSKVQSHRAFYYLMFNSKSFIDFLVSNATGSTNSRMRVRPASSLDFEFLCPNDDVLDNFCSKVEPLLAQIDKNTLEIRKLNELIPILVAKMMLSSN